MNDQVIPTQAVEAKCRHMLVTVYSRPRWNWFRKTYSLRCWTCDVVVYE